MFVKAILALHLLLSPFSCIEGIFQLLFLTIGLMRHFTFGISAAILRCHHICWTLVDLLTPVLLSSGGTSGLAP